MKRGNKSCRDKSDYKEASEVDVVQIFRIEKKVGDSQVFPEAAGNHGEKNYPAENQNDIPF